MATHLITRSRMIVHALIRIKHRFLSGHRVQIHTGTLLPNFEQSKDGIAKACGGVRIFTVRKGWAIGKDCLFVFGSGIGSFFDGGGFAFRGRGGFGRCSRVKFWQGRHLGKARDVQKEEVSAGGEEQ
jgi:hypothetical protein